MSLSKRILAVAGRGEAHLGDRGDVVALAREVADVEQLYLEHMIEGDTGIRDVVERLSRAAASRTRELEEARARFAEAQLDVGWRAAVEPELERIRVALRSVLPNSGGTLAAEVERLVAKIARAESSTDSGAQTAGDVTAGGDATRAPESGRCLSCGGRGFVLAVDNAGNKYVGCKNCRIKEIP